MHPYSTDSTERKWIPLIILIISVFCAAGSKLYWDSLNLNGTLGEFYYIASLFVDLSVIIFYEVFYFIFDNFLWKYCRIVDVPDLSGQWKGTLDSSYSDKDDDMRTEVKATMEINQTWQKIEIRLKTDKSNSKTVTAAFFTTNPKKIELSYQYRNDPKPHAVDTMNIHDGTGWVTLSNDRKSFEGRYYNGRGSNNQGSLKFVKIDS